MEMQRDGKGLLQWHQAFYAGVQIELEQDAYNLIFENEHQLGTKPKSIDVLVIKKNLDIPIKKNIGRIFRKHNIIEYKSPTDYLSVDDFYKIYGYTCFYKADSAVVNKIKLEDLTITLVCHSYPKMLLWHLEEERGYTIKKAEPGIYSIIGDVLPIQLILTRELSDKENLWLKSLTNDLPERKQAKMLVNEYKKHENEEHYSSMMDIIIRANEEIFQEVKADMCDALRELMKDEIKAELEASEARGKTIGEARGKAHAIEELICKKLDRGLSVKDISYWMELEEAYVAKIAKLHESHPSYDADRLRECLKK